MAQHRAAADGDEGTAASAPSAATPAADSAGESPATDPGPAGSVPGQPPPTPVNAGGAAQATEAPQEKAAPPEPDPAEALAAAQAKAAANWDKFLRTRADLENYRRRMDREIATVAREAKQDVLLQMFAVLDNLRLAAAYEQSDGQIDVKGLVAGLRMILSQFEDVVTGLGVQAIQSVGEKFDPRWHQAVATEEDSEREEGLIVEEVQRGYRSSDEQILRPARVKVIARPGSSQ